MRAPELPSGRDLTRESDTSEATPVSSQNPQQNSEFSLVDDGVERSAQPVANETPIEHLRNALQILDPARRDYRERGDDPAALWAIEQTGHDVELAARRVELAIEQLQVAGFAPRFSPRFSAPDLYAGVATLPERYAQFETGLANKVVVDILRTAKKHRADLETCRYLTTSPDDEAPGEREDFERLQSKMLESCRRAAALLICIADDKGLL